MIEVFSTNVTDREQANSLIEKIHAEISGCRANFDLDDCDNILRIDAPEADIDHQHIIQLLHHHGYHAQVLP